MSTLLPEIITLRDDGPGRRTLTLHIQPELAYFAGHFPGLPLLPGVVQMDWAARFGHEHLGVRGPLLSVDNLKFQAMIFPGAILELELEWQPDSGRLHFSFSQDGQAMSSGRFVFGTQEAA